ncbi:MAG: 2,3-bisphosphoglycerate-independent phosphoglycerate mutase [Candidatus Aenigmatarchaeota archaeon]
MRKKVLFVILDGAADVGEKTPLSDASKPNLDLLAKNGVAGLVENRNGEHPDSGISNFVLLGYPKEEYPGRGYLEALGANLRITPDSVYVRANFATVREVVDDELKTGTFEPHLIVTDRRAGRDNTGLLDMSKTIREFFLDGVRIDFFKSLAHRGVVALNSVNLSSNVSDSDPNEGSNRVRRVEPLTGDGKAVRTAAALNKFSKEVYKILKDHPSNKYRDVPANYILLRGASQYQYVKSFKDMFGLSAACIAASPVIKGIARAMDMEVIEVSGATADLKTNLTEKTLKALDALKTHDFVVLHILGADVASHDKSFNQKRFFIEKIDREVFRRILEYVDFEKNMVAVTSDHITSVKDGEHKPGFIPFAIYTKGIEANGVMKYDEESCKSGPVIHTEDFMEELIRFIA